MIELCRVTNWYSHVNITMKNFWNSILPRVQGQVWIKNDWRNELISILEEGRPKTSKEVSAASWLSCYSGHLNPKPYQYHMSIWHSTFIWRFCAEMKNWCLWCRSIFNEFCRKFREISHLAGEVLYLAVIDVEKHTVYCRISTKSIFRSGSKFLKILWVKMTLCTDIFQRVSRINSNSDYQNCIKVYLCMHFLLRLYHNCFCAAQKHTFAAEPQNKDRKKYNLI